MIQYLGAIFLGWSLGANDSANVFGAAVSSRMVSYKRAVILTSIFIVLGAVTQGEAGIRTLSRLATQGMRTAMLVSLAAAVTVTLMTLLKLPVSTSQAVVGAIIGMAITQGQVHFDGLGKVVLCWLGTPVGGCICSILLYYVFKAIIRYLRPDLFAFDGLMRAGLILMGCYGAYALGANNVANVTGVFVGPDMLTPFQAALLGSVSIAIGVVSFSRAVMMTVGKGVIILDAFSALVCVTAHAVTVHFYAMIGVPVSTSQAIVGAVFGIGFVKGFHTVDFKMLRNILCGWLLTPVAGAGIAAILGLASG